MALLEGTLRDLSNLMKQHHICDTICPCNDIFSTMVIFGESKQLDQNSLLVECKIVPFGCDDLWPSFLPGDRCLECPHEKKDIFHLAMHQHLWREPLITGAKVLLYNVVNRPWLHTPLVESRTRNAGIFVVADLPQSDFLHGGEICTGAFSGWSHAVKAMAHLGIQIRHSWGIEIDPICCDMVSKTHGFHRIVDAKDLEDVDGSDISSPPLVFQMDIRESWAYQYIFQHTDFLMMSPPCQPWTSAVHDAKGLNRRDGMTLIWCWAKAKMVAPKYVLMEMVANLTKHPHWGYVKQIIRWAGFEILWTETMQLADVFPQSRNRLLLTAVRRDIRIEIPSSPWVTWPKGVKHTLRSFGCILHECERFREDPFLSNELLQVYLNVKLAPKDVSDVNGKPINKDRMRKIRLKSLDDHVFPCILANYTKAHHLPIELLIKNGLFGGLFMQEGRPRFLTSPEIFVLMGGTSASFLPACKDARIHTLGNCISVPHAAIILLNFLAICHERYSEIDIQQMFASIMALRIKNDNMRVRIMEEGIFIDNLAFDQPSISPTIPMVTFVQIVVQSPTETFKFWLDSRVHILPAMRLLVGESMPSKVEVVIHEHFHMVVEESDTIETCGQLLKIGVPCILHVHDDKLTRSNTTMVAILTPFGPIIIKKDTGMTMLDVQRKVREFFPEISKIFGDEIVAVNPVGYPEPSDRVCGDMIHIAKPLQPDMLNEFFLQDLEFVCEVGSLHIPMTMNRLNDVIAHFSRLGIDQALMSMGWMMVMGQDHKINGISHKLIFVRQPGAIAVNTTSIQMMIASKLMMAMTKPPIEQGEKSFYLRIKLWNFVIWEGWYHEDGCPNDFIRLWDKVCDTMKLDVPLRAIIRGQNANIDVPFRVFRHVALQDQHDILRMHLITGLRGGGNKTDEIITTKNSIAVFLLSKGADLQQTSHFADVVTRSAGVVAIQRLMSIPDEEERINAMQQMSKSLHIQWPNFPKDEKESNKLIQKAAAKKKAGHKQTIKAESFKLISENFVNEDGSVCTIRQDIAPNTAGVALVDKEVARQWLDDFKIISQDELAMVVLGHDCPSKNPSECKPVQVSALGPNGQPAVLQCCLHNLGMKKVKLKSKPADQVIIASSSIIAITIYRDEVGVHDWKSCVDHPVRFAMEALGIDDESSMVSPPWGRSWINQKGKCEPHEALSFQCHTRIPQNKLESWMRKSGMNGVFVVPKGEDHQLDTRFQIIWLEQTSIELAKTAVDHPNHLGIVRNSKPKGDIVRTMRGIRFTTSDFNDAWKILKPHDPCPEKIAIKHLYKISPVPIAAKHTDVKEWLKGQGWTARPIKALGANMWLIGSEEKQDLSFMSWNGHSILVRAVNQQVVSKSSPVVAGHIPKAGVGASASVNTFKSGDPYHDPWAQYRGSQDIQVVNASGPSNTRAAANPRQVEAPIEQRFKAQDAKIDELSNQITQMKERAETNEKKDADFRSQVTTEFAAVRSEVDRHLTKMTENFEHSLERAMAKQDRSLGSSIHELKLLLQEKANPSKKARATPREKDDNPNKEDMEL